MWPMPSNLGDLLGSFDRILVPEMNTGQFVHVIRSHFMLDTQALNKVSGQPFKIREIEEAIVAQLEVA